MSTWLCQDLIGPKKFVREFLGRPGHMKELGLNIDLTADLELWSRDLLGISRHLVSVLSFSNVQLQLLVQLIKVSEKTWACANARLHLG